MPQSDSAAAEILAFLPGGSRSGIEEALGVPVRLCAKLGDFLAALGEGGAGRTNGPQSGEGAAGAAEVGDARGATRVVTNRILFLTLDNPAVDPTLARRIVEENASDPLFLISAENSIARILLAERAGATALLPYPLDAATLRREVLPLIVEPGEVSIPQKDAAAPARSGGHAPTDGRGSPRGREGESTAGPGTPAREEEKVVGSSPALFDVFRIIARAADSNSPVLIAGESGTGKEVVARALHSQGQRADRPFVAVNCAAIPDTLLEAELFGYEKGAFTGAIARSDGRIGRAHGGTLFLDEIGEMSLPLQAKLLRFLESGEIERLGSREATIVDARIVAATNRDLRALVSEGSFREDFLFRLAVVEVALPPLRDRPEDVGALLRHFASSFAAKHRRPVRAFSRAAWDLLLGYPWPGNVRELRNVMDRAVLLARGGVIRVGNLRLGAEAPRTSPVDEGSTPGYPPTLSLREVEMAHIRAVLRHTGGKMGEAAEILGIHRNTMTLKVREYGIDPASYAQGWD